MLVSIPIIIMLVFMGDVEQYQLTSSSCKETYKEKNGVSCDCEECDKRSDEIEISLCCDCRTSFNIQLTPLELEYTSLGWAEILGHKGDNSSLQHNNGGLLFIPWNICDYPNLRRLDLANNMILSICKLSCLGALDELRLTNNLIHYLSRDTFLGMDGLRILDVSMNYIHVLDTGTFGPHTPSIKEINLSSNDLEQFDFSNLNLNSFCELSLQHNKLRKIVNEDQMTADVFKGRGPGYINLRENNFTQFPDWHELKVGNITSLGVFAEWGFGTEGNPWVCDCMLYSFLSVAQKPYRAVEHKNVATCQNPPEFRGKRVMEDVRPDQLICNLTDLCPDVCECRSQPSELSIFVDCQDAGLTELPLDLPFMHGLSLVINMSGNSIRKLAERLYWSRVKKIDLSENDLTTIPAQVAKMLENATEINLKGNKFKFFPQEIQMFSSSVLQLDLDHIYCNCTLGWLVDWVNNYQPNNTDAICNIAQTVVHMDLSHFLGTCSPVDHTPAILGGSLGILALLTVIASILSYIFRYEIMVLSHDSIGPYLKRSRVHPVKDVDIYLSMGDGDIVWAKDVLIPRLEGEDISVFVPERDIDPGEVEVDAILKAVSGCKSAFVVISPSYLDSQSKMDEFNCLCRSMVKNLSGIVSVAIHEDADIKSCKNPYLRAFVRLRKYHKGLNEKTVVDALSKIIHRRVRPRPRFMEMHLMNIK